MSIFTRMSRRRRHLADQRPASATVQPAQPAAVATSRPSPSTDTSVHRHGSCPVKHRTATAAERCTKG